MSLAKRLGNVQPNHANKGCRTCAYLNALPKADSAAWNQWLDEGHSAQQLYEIAHSDPENPLQVSLTAFRHHMRHCRGSE